MALMTEADNRSFGFLISDVTRLLRKHFDRRAERFGLTRAQWRAMKRLHLTEGMTQSELAEMLELEPIAVGRVIDRLQQSEFVERRADPKDRRCWRLYLTERAHAVLDDMDVISRELRGDACVGVADADFEKLLQVLEKMKENLQWLDNPASQSSASK